MTSSAPDCRSRRDSGFTLLELLIAISILALMFTLLTGGIRFGVAAWQKGSDIGRHAGEIRTAHRLLRRQIEQLRPVVMQSERRRGRRVAFVGEPDTLRFIAPPPAQSAPPGIYLIQLAIAPAPDGKRLALFWRRLQPDHADFTEDGDLKSVVLGQGLAGGVIDYFGRARGEDVPRWHRRWVGREAVPELIRIRLTYPDDDDRQWPDLIAAPQLGAR